MLRLGQAHIQGTRWAPQRKDAGLLIYQTFSHLGCDILDICPLNDKQHKNKIQLLSPILGIFNTINITIKAYFFERNPLVFICVSNSAISHKITTRSTYLFPPSWLVIFPIKHFINFIQCSLPLRGQSLVPGEP